jgi:ornithine carbamoyltransferase
MDKRSLPALQCLSENQIEELLRLTADFSRERHHFGRDVLAGCRIGLLFDRPSTRTRLSFSIAAVELGATVFDLPLAAMQTTTGETKLDTALVLSRYLDSVVIRSKSEDWWQALATAGVSAINGLDEKEHPTQALADLVTIKSLTGRLQNLRVLFLGEAGNICRSFVLALSCFRGNDVMLCGPEDYLFDEAEYRLLGDRYGRNGASFRQVGSLGLIRDGIDVVYVTRWRSMGEEKSDANWRQYFSPFQLNETVWEKLCRADTVLLHDLPAERDAEITSSLLDRQIESVLLQARNKIASAKAALSWCLGSTMPRASTAKNR